MRSRSVRMEHRIPRQNQRPKLPASHHPVCPAIAIHEHGGTEPLPVEPSETDYTIEFHILVIDAVVGAEPALLDPCLPAKINLLSLEKPPCQCLPGTAPELPFKPRAQRFHHSIHDLGRPRSNTLLPAPVDSQHLSSPH